MNQKKNFFFLKRFHEKIVFVFNMLEINARMYLTQFSEDKPDKTCITVRN